MGLALIVQHYMETSEMKQYWLMQINDVNKWKFTNSSINLKINANEMTNAYNSVTHSPLCLLFLKLLRRILQSPIILNISVMRSV